VTRWSQTVLADSSNAAEICRLLGVDALCFTNIAEVNDNTKRATMLTAYLDNQTIEVVMDARVVQIAAVRIAAEGRTSSRSRVRG
jgi:hypothetical protein